MDGGEISGQSEHYWVKGGACMTVLYYGSYLGLGERIETLSHVSISFIVV